MKKTTYFHKKLQLRKLKNQYYLYYLVLVIFWYFCDLQERKLLINCLLNMLKEKNSDSILRSSLHTLDYLMSTLYLMILWNKWKLTSSKQTKKITSFYVIVWENVFVCLCQHTSRHLFFVEWLTNKEENLIQRDKCGGKISWNIAIIFNAYKYFIPKNKSFFFFGKQIFIC